MKQLLPKLLNRSYSLLFILSFLLSSLGWGQNLTISNATNGSTYTTADFSCGSSQLSGSLTADNQDFWICICPNAGDYLSLEFTTIDLYDGNGGNNDDWLYVYQGCGIGGPLLYNPTPSNGVTQTVTSPNPGECLTVRIQERGNWIADPNSILANIWCFPPPANDDPCGALPMTPFASCSYSSVSNLYATNTVLANVPAPTGCPGYGGSDVWYSIEMPSDGYLNFDAQNNGGLSDGVLTFYTSSDNTCSGNFTQIGCNDDCPGFPFADLMPCAVINNPALAGQTVWIRVYDYGGNQEGTFDVCAQGNIVCTDYTVNDCDGAIPLCSNSPVSGFYSGQGCDADLNPGNDGCLAGEHNTAWYYIRISDGGTDNTWGFDGVFDVNQNWIEYDWALWGPFNSNQLPGTADSPCDALGSPIRCSFASQAGKSEVGLGMIDNENNQVVEGSSPSGDGYLEWIEPGGATNPANGAQAGDVYILMIDRWSNFGNDYNLTFSGTAVMDCTILPIELMGFWGERSGRENVIHWITASEHENDYFTIERSNDLQSWEVLGVEDGAGNSEEEIAYYMIDHDPFKDVTYYRLRQTDYNGKDKLSHMISIVSTVEAEGLFTELFPNPTNNSFYFNYAGTNLKESIEVMVYNNAGQLVNSKSIQNFNKNQSISVDLEGLQNGMYQVVLRQGERSELRRISLIK